MDKEVKKIEDESLLEYVVFLEMVKQKAEEELTKSYRRIKSELKNRKR